MKIDKERVKREFAEYVRDYNAEDEKIKLKIVHTYRVAEICEAIARSLDFREDDVDFAWLSGMLHDIGRFEQLRRYGTFSDAESIDHAGFGADLLFGTERLIDRFIEASSEYQCLENVIRCHSAYRIPEEYDARTRQFAEILRDADKVDILRVNVEFALEDIYNVTTEVLMREDVSEAVMKSFFEHHATLRSIKKTCIDHLVGHISLVYELVYPKSIELVKEQGYLEKMMNFHSQNEKTNQQFAMIREEMTEWLQEQIK